MSKIQRTAGKPFPPDRTDVLRPSVHPRDQGGPRACALVCPSDSFLWPHLPLHAPASKDAELPLCPVTRRKRDKNRSLDTLLRKFPVSGFLLSFQTLPTQRFQDSGCSLSAGWCGGKPAPRSAKTISRRHSLAVCVAEVKIRASSNATRLSKKVIRLREYE